MAFYHTYRPQNFTDIAHTQSSVARQLAGSLLSDKVSNAYLFTGSHGIGKTSCARILAKALNCEQYSQLANNSKKATTVDLSHMPVPCGACSSCISIVSGSAVDVVELDAASHRGIDDIRELRENIRLSPAVLRKKVYIIDEVHMLTTEAFNALLKTLEEPPAHAVFILCTTDKDRVPMTIQSRCTLITFVKPTVETIKGYLTHIAQSENLSATPEALQYIAKISHGAFRDAAKHLEQSALVSPSITLESVQTQFTGADFGGIAEIISTLAKGHIQEFLALTRRMESHNAHFAEIIHDLIEQYRLFVLHKSGVTVTEMVASTEFFDVSSYVSSHDYSYFSECIDVLLKALQQQRSSPIAALPLELAGVRIISLQPTRQPITPHHVSEPDTVKKEDMKARVPVEAPVKVTEKDKKVAQQQAKPPTTEPVSRDDSPVKIEKIANEEQLHPVTKQGDVQKEQIKSVVVESDSIAMHVPDGSVTFDVVKTRWSEVIRLMRRYNASMATLMNKCKPVRLEGKTIIIETHYSFHKDMLESSKNRPVIEQALFELLGAQLRIKGSLSNTRVIPKQVENVTEVSNDDLMAAVQEIFGA